MDYERDRQIAHRRSIVRLLYKSRTSAKAFHYSEGIGCSRGGE